MSYTTAEIAAKKYAAWDILVERAKSDKRPLTYSEIAERIGLGVNYRRLTGPFLYPIQSFCQENAAPPLTVMVKLSTGGYGKGFEFSPYKSKKSAIQAVREFADWDLLRLRFFGLLERSDSTLLRQKLKESSSDKSTSGRTERRGRRQPLFSSLVYGIYHGQCAVCDIDQEELLDAAHIKPWAKSSATEKVDPANGLLLCKNHHAAFDAKLWWVGEKGEVYAIARDLMESLRTYTKLRLPKESKDSPMCYLDKHRKRHKLKV